MELPLLSSHVRLNILFEVDNRYQFPYSRSASSLRETVMLV